MSRAWTGHHSYCRGRIHDRHVFCLFVIGRSIFLLAANCGNQSDWLAAESQRYLYGRFWDRQCQNRYGVDLMKLLFHLLIINYALVEAIVDLLLLLLHHLSALNRTEEIIIIIILYLYPCMMFGMAYGSDICSWWASLVNSWFGLGYRDNAWVFVRLHHFYHVFISLIYQLVLVVNLERL